MTSVPHRASINSKCPTSFSVFRIPLPLRLRQTQSIATIAMATMKAVLIKQPGDASQLYIGDTEKPVPKNEEILIKVKYFCLNRMDIWQRQGQYPPPPGGSHILGVEVSGIVEEVGKDVKDFKIGDKVFGLMPGGGYASYATMNHGLAMHVPDSLTLQMAAAIPEVWLTAYQALHFIAGLQEGQDVLIHAAASGVGVAAIQLAKLAKAKRIFTTAGSDSKAQLTKELGATAGFNYKTTDWKDKILELTDGKGVDVIIDFVGKDYFEKNLACIARDGRIVFLAFLSGSVVDNFDLNILLSKRIKLEGSGLRSRSLDYQYSLRAALERDVIQPHFSIAGHGDLRIIIDREFGWSEIQEAHRYLESNQSIGKIVVRVEDE